MKLLYDIVDYLTLLLQHGGIISGILLVLLESIIPALPLGVFVALNVNAFGVIVGIIISWLATCLGCYLSFLLFSMISKKYIKEKIKNPRLKKIEKKMKKIDFSKLVVIIALPFTPAFLINIACGLVKTSKRKFLFALLTGKIFMILFWGLIGKSLIESVTDISTIIIICIFILVAYLISKILNKKFQIE